MQLVSARIWTRVAESISYDGNHYTTGTSRPDNNNFWDFAVPDDQRVKLKESE